MDQLQISTARHHTYSLLSRLFLQGLTADLHPYVDEIPQLAAVCPRPFNSDQSAADHQHIFSYDIYPYESLFRDPQGLLGGPITIQIAEDYRLSGFKSTEEPGHIGTELAYLAYLCEGQALSLQGDCFEDYNRYTNFQIDFLNKHLLHWLPAFEIALSFSGSPFYASLGHVALDLVSDHMASSTLDNRPHTQNWDAPSPPDIWNDPQTNLKRIAHHLATPPYSGLYLGREAISELARLVDLPRGFGGRRQMMGNLLRSAGQYGTVPALFSAMAAFAVNWQESFERQIVNHPHLAAWIQPWRQLAQETAESLSRMQELALASEKP